MREAIAANSEFQVVLGDALSTRNEEPSTAHAAAASATATTTTTTNAKAQPDDENVPKKKRKYQWAVAGMVLIIFTSVFATALNTSDSGRGGDSPGWFVQVLGNAFSLTAFVTYEDKAAFVGASLYVIYYCIRVQVSL